MAIFSNIRFFRNNRIPGEFAMCAIWLVTTQNTILIFIENPNAMLIYLSNTDKTL
jgi:hypothetical protein